MKRRVLSLGLAILLCVLLSSATAATRGEENALRSAMQYLEFMNFSYSGLMGQLEYEGYSDSECKYAVDNCGADWYDQAAGCAEDYLSYTSFSKSGLISQLEYEGFTSEEAQYGAAVAYGEDPVKPRSTVLQPNTTTQADSDGEQTTTETEEELVITETQTQTTSGETYDLSTMSFDELIALQSILTEEILTRSEWREIRVPVGTYTVGVDIPAGIYTVTIRENSTNFWVKDGQSGHTLQNLALYSTDEDRNIIKRLVLEEGNIVEINSSAVYFSPYTGLGF